MGGDKDAPSTAKRANNPIGFTARPTAGVGAEDGRRLSAELEVQQEPEPEQTLEPSRFATITPPAAIAAANKQTASTPTVSGSNERIPTVTEATLEGSLSVTPLHLDIHVYSSNPAERFVFINTNRYKEGERISEGPTVKSITKQGVILNYQGRNYLLTRD
jgi:hypothetical protein